MDTASLNQYFSIEGHLHFETGRGGLTKAVVNNTYALCELYLQGAHIVSFKPHNREELLWVSSTAQYASGKAIRGGVPLCWPWFGPDPENAGRPQHGFARNALWTFVDASVNQRGETVLKLVLHKSSESYKVWPFTFEAEYSIIVGNSLRLELSTKNRDSTPFTLTQALHTYFAVDAIEQSRVENYVGKRYIDKLLENRECVQEGDLRFEDEVDRIYLDEDLYCILSDSRRSVKVSKQNSKSTVIWNPWREKASSMGDFDDEGYRNMVCIETANAAFDARILNPGECHTLVQTIEVWL